MRRNRQKYRRTGFTSSRSQIFELLDQVQISLCTQNAQSTAKEEIYEQKIIYTKPESKNNFLKQKPLKSFEELRARFRNEIKLGVINEEHDHEALQVLKADEIYNILMEDIQSWSERLGINKERDY